MLGDICTRYRLKVNLRIFAIGRLLNKQLNTTVRNLRFSLVTSSYGVHEEGKEMTRTESVLSVHEKGAAVTTTCHLYVLDRI